VLAFPSRSKRGRKPKDAADSYRVSVEQVSKNTYAVRIRWKRPDRSEDGIVVNRLRGDIVKEIKRSKKRYDQFKTQTIASWNSRAVRQSDGA
jgi:CRISPR/Cas system-associated exonuclease Cas4 (RecB family)